MMKKQLLLLAMMLLPMIAHADKSGTCGENLTWTLVESTGTLTIEGSGAMTNYNTNNGSRPWDEDREKISTVVICDGVTSIGSRAFYGCSGLASVTISNSVASIGNEAFYGCYIISNINIHVTDFAAFCNNTIVYRIRNEINTSPKIHLADSEGKEIQEYIIPDGVTSVGERAFYGCSGLTSVIIPNSVASIGGSAFLGCSSLTSAIIGNSVTSIGGSAFSGCSGLTTITIPNSVTSIGNSAFYGCVKLATIYCLNPTPPTCYGISTFSGSSSYLRDQFDVYTYATLHVPMGSEELYSSAYEWRYFNKIKEDMESNGQVYYANLTVRQGTTGYTRQPVKAAETYTIYIGSLGDNKVNAVIFNGADVTNDVVNGYYTTPEIKGESVLSVTYETNISALSEPGVDNLKVTGNNGEISIANIDRASSVTVYTVDGKVIDNIPSVIGSARLQVSTDQLYIVKVNNRTFKVAM